MNGKYTQQELLLLSNFVYIPACLSDRPIGEIIDSYREADGTFTEESVAAAAAGGGMSCADVRTVFSEMDRRIKENPGFGKLSASRCLEENDVRAVCYTDPKDDDPVVVFRGTGGTKEAWIDNFEGAYYEDTRIQQLAGDFIESECGIYKDIVVTGHSKGGNLAQYVTVKQGEKVGSCVSFDGQGFGDGFLDANAEAVRCASPKICSVSAYNDFVGILLTCIAGTVIYVENDPSPAGAHSPVTLLTHNTFDGNGDFASVRGQGPVAAGLSHVTGVICEALSPLETDDKETLGTITGSAISMALTTREGLLEGCVAPTLGAVSAAYIRKLAGTSAAVIQNMPLRAKSVHIDAAHIRLISESIREQSREVDLVASAVEEIRQSMAYTINSRICAEHALEKVYYDLTGLRERMVSFSELTGSVAVMYEQAESDAASLMNLKES